jgi:hypothetical protein
LTALCDALPPDVLAIFDAKNPDKTTRSNAQGAATSVWAAIAPVLENHGGLYLEDERVALPAVPGVTSGFAEYAYDGEAAKRLWEQTCRIVGVGKDD